MTTDYDLAIVTANPAGQSLARQAFAAGLERIVLIDEDHRELIDLGGDPDTVFGSAPRTIGTDKDGVVVAGDDFSITARVAVVAGRPIVESKQPGYPVPDGLSDRLHFTPDVAVAPEEDVAVIGIGETAARIALELVNAGIHELIVSLPASSFDNLSELTRERLLAIEA